MKYLIIILLTTAFASVSQAGYRAKVLYWYNTNVSTNATRLEKIVTIQDDSDGSGLKLKWKIKNHPTKKTIDAIDDNVATNWLKGKKANSNRTYVDIQALLNVISELTGTPIGEVKNKFKNAKKTKEKNK